jgi:hypothetical protein
MSDIHSSFVGHLCADWKEGDRDCSDFRFVDCDSCKDWMDYGRAGLECPCGDPLPEIESGNGHKCSHCGAEFIAVDVHLVIPMPTESAIEESQ